MPGHRDLADVSLAQTGLVAEAEGDAHRLHVGRKLRDDGPADVQHAAVAAQLAHLGAQAAVGSDQGPVPAQANGVDGRDGRSIAEGVVLLQRRHGHARGGRPAVSGRHAQAVVGGGAAGDPAHGVHRSPDDRKGVVTTQREAEGAGDRQRPGLLVPDGVGRASSQQACGSWVWGLRLMGVGLRLLADPGAEPVVERTDVVLGRDQHAAVGVGP